MIIVQPARLRDVLYNTHPSSGSSIDYGKGCILGVVSFFMAGGASFESSWRKTMEYLPTGYRKECIPETWDGL